MIIVRKYTESGLQTNSSIFFWKQSEVIYCACGVGRAPKAPPPLPYSTVDPEMFDDNPAPTISRVAAPREPPPGPALPVLLAEPSL